MTLWHMWILILGLSAFKEEDAQSFSLLIGIALILTVLANVL